MKMNIILYFVCLYLLIGFIMSLYTFSSTWNDIKKGKLCVIIASFIYCMVTWIRIVFSGFRLRKTVNDTRKGRRKDSLQRGKQK